MGFLADFKKFALRGNVVDLAVGVIIGASFGTITKSMVDDMLMPPLGLLIGRVDFKEQFLALDRDAYERLSGELNAARAAAEGENRTRAAAGQPPVPLPPAVAPTLEQAREKGIPTLRYGVFVNACLNFVFIAFAVFLLVTGMTKLQKREAPPPPGPTPTERLLTEIRDALQSRPASR